MLKFKIENNSRTIEDKGKILFLIYVIGIKCLILISSIFKFCLHNIGWKVQSNMSREQFYFGISSILRPYKLNFKVEERYESSLYSCRLKKKFHENQRTVLRVAHNAISYHSLAERVAPVLNPVQCLTKALSTSISIASSSALILVSELVFLTVLFCGRQLSLLTWH